MKMKKMRLKFSTIILTLSLVFPASFIPAFAAEPVANAGKIEFYTESTDDLTAICEAISEGIKNFEETINVYDFKVSTGNIRAVINRVFYSHPEFFYLSTACSYTKIGTTLYSIKPQYMYDKATAEKLQAEIDDKADEILSKIDNDMSDLRKAVIVHDEIVDCCAYNSDETEEFTRASIYDCLVNGQALCVGYTKAYSYLLSKLGIDSEIVVSDSMSHTWNKICLDGEYYNADVTWDDPLGGKPGYINHTYFLFSDSEFMASKEHSDYLSINSADNTKYDSLLLKQINTRLCFVDDDCYTIYNNNNNSQYEKCLLKYNPDSDEAEVVTKFEYKWMVPQTNSYWVGGFMCLAEKDGILYYNSPDAILAYDVATGESEVIVENSYEYDFYGMYLRGNDIYGYVSENPNIEGETYLVGTCKAQAVLGDVDKSGDLTISDATVLQRHLAKIITLSDEALAVADVDGNGRINICDVTEIQYILAGYR